MNTVKNLNEIESEDYFVVIPPQKSFSHSKSHNNKTTIQEVPSDSVYQFGGRPLHNGNYGGAGHPGDWWRNYRNRDAIARLSRSGGSPYQYNILLRGGGRCKWTRNTYFDERAISSKFLRTRSRMIINVSNPWNYF